MSSQKRKYILNREECEVLKIILNTYKLVSSQVNSQSTSYRLLPPVLQPGAK